MISSPRGVSLILVTPKKADKFPLWLHPNRQWAKKIHGRTRYFGTNRDAALKEYVRTREDRKPAATPRHPNLTVPPSPNWSTVFSQPSANG